MVGFILIDVIELVELEAISVDEIIDNLFEVILFRGCAIVEEVEG